MKTLTALAVAAACACPMVAHAALPLSAPVPNQPAYTTVALAEQAAAVALVECSREFECGLALYTDSTGWHFTAPVSAGLRWGWGVDYRVALPPGAQLRELLHTHPGENDLALGLSWSDRDLARTTGVPVVAYAINAHKFVRR